MGKEDPKVVDTYSQIQAFLQTVKDDADFKTKIALMEKDLETFLTEAKINKMIWKAIKDHGEGIENINKNRIQWGPIIERIVTAVITVIITALVIKGMG